MSITVELPWPDKALSPNGRAHWRTVAKAKKKARCNTYYEALHQIGLHRRDAFCGDVGDSDIMVKCTFHPKTTNKPDEDNLLASMKPAFDGLADWLYVDDSKFRQQPPIIAEPVKGGKVIVELEVAR